MTFVKTHRSLTPCSDLFWLRQPEGGLYEQELQESSFSLQD